MTTMESKEGGLILQEADNDSENKIQDEEKITSSLIEEAVDESSTSTKDILRSSHFSLVLSKIEEVDESRIKSPLISDEDDSEKFRENLRINEAGNRTTQSPHVMWKSEDEIIHIDDDEVHKKEQRPKSANYIGRVNVLQDHIVQNRPNIDRDVIYSIDKKKMPKSVLKSSSSRYSDSESNSESSFVSVIGRPRSAGSKPRHSNQNCSTWKWNKACFWDPHYPSRPRSAYSVRANDYADDYCSVLNHKGMWMPCKTNLMTYQARKCRSNPNVAKSKPGSSNSELKIDRFKRSLKLLGLQVTDFGIFDRESEAMRCNRPKEKLKRVESTISTKIVRRSVSLDGLKELVKEAWMDDRLDSSHRKLLSQAAYEEWYFRKAEEAQRKRTSERMRKKLIKEKLEDEFRSRRIKAEEQFRQWIEGKKLKKKIERNSKKATLSQFRLVKTPEEVEAAYRRWKEKKDKQEKEKHKLEQIENQKKVEQEKQKEQKKTMAQRAFSEWKRKVEETEKVLAQIKIRKETRKLEIKRKKREQCRKTSFQTWKDMKDKESIMKKQEMMNALRTAKEERLTQLEERMYEAEQAFEEWLDKIESRERSLQTVLTSKKTASRS